MRLLPPLFLALTALTCSPSRSGDALVLSTALLGTDGGMEPLDAGVTLVGDAGTVALDSGAMLIEDAGTLTLDSGVTFLDDAGTAPPDAGVATLDDAGAIDPRDGGVLHHGTGEDAGAGVRLGPDAGAILQSELEADLGCNATTGVPSRALTLLMLLGGTLLLRRRPAQKP